MEQNLLAHKADVTSIERRTLAMNARHDECTRARKDVHKAVKVLGDLEQELGKLKKVAKEVRSKQQIVSSHEASMREVAESKTMKARALARTTEKIEKLVKRREEERGSS